MQLPIPIKPGDTYELVCSLDLDGVAQDLTDIEIRSDVRTRGGAIAFTCSVDKIADAEGHLTLFRLRAEPAQTAAAPLGPLESDIVYTWPDGSVDTTPTFALVCARRVTQ